MTAEETSLLVMLAETARLLDTISPDPKTRTRHFQLKERALKSISKVLSSWKISDSYVAAIAGMGAAAVRLILPLNSIL